MAFHLPKWWGPLNRKPPPGSTINWGHPMTAGLVDAVIYNEQGGQSPRSLVNNEGATQAAAGVGWIKTVGGAARKFDSAHADLWADTGRRRITGALTLAVGWFNTNPALAAGWQELVSKRGTSGSASVEFGMNYNLGSSILQGFWAASGVYQLIQVTGWTPTQFKLYQHVLIRIANGTAGDLYENGVLVTNSANTGKSVAAQSTNQVAAGAIANGEEPTGVPILYWYLWNRQLTKGEIRSLSFSPYQFIQPPRFNLMNSASKAASVFIGSRFFQILGVGT